LAAIADPHIAAKAAPTINTLVFRPLLRAVNRGREKILHPIEGQQQGLIHRTISLNHARLVQRLEQKGKQRCYLPRFGGVQHVANTARCLKS